MAGIVERLASRFGFVKQEQAQAAMQALVSSFGGVGGTSLTAADKSYKTLVDAYRSWTYTCIDKIAKSVSTLKVRLYVYRAGGTKAKVVLPGTIRAELKALPNDRAREIRLKQAGLEREEITVHPFLYLISHPNPQMTRFLLWYETMVRLELAGSCGWYTPLNRAGIPGEIWPLPITSSASLIPVVTPTLRVSEWKYRDGSVDVTFPPEEVLFLRYPHPGSPFKGMSPLVAQTVPYDVDYFIGQQQKALFENRAIPGLHLHTDQILGQDQLDEIKLFIRDQYEGAMRTGRTLVTHSGLKAEGIGMTNKDALIADVSKWAREKIITAYDLSEGKLGLVTDVNRANMEALNETFIRDCLLPKTMLIEEALENWLLPFYDQGLTLDFVLPDLDTREADRLDMEARLKNLVTSVNEERERLGLEEAEWGEKPWIPSGLTQFGEEPPPGPTPPAPPRRPGNGADEDEEEQEGESSGTA